MRGAHVWSCFLAGGWTGVWTASCVLEGSGALLEAPLGEVLVALGDGMAALVVVLDALGAVLEASWALLEQSWRRLGRILGALGCILAANWEAKKVQNGDKETI